LSIKGSLHAEVTGPSDASSMVFVHANPMDGSSWLYQIAHFSAWYRCIAIDLPGYYRSPPAGAGLRLEDVAAACWTAVDRRSDSDRAILVGSSVGSFVVQHMYHLRPEATQALILSGTGWYEVKPFVSHRVAGFREHGIDYRYRYTLETFSDAFRSTPLAEWFARLFCERNSSADLDTIVMLFEAQAVPEPEALQSDLQAPVLIVSGSEDPSHEAAFVLRDRLPNAEIVTLEGAGHACHMEQPWAFDREVISFLRQLGQAPARVEKADRER
jgi:pimeloyl-ACP methyl ester carboxylesterase